MTTPSENQNPILTETQNENAAESAAPVARVGKIARLPRHLREQLNTRLEAGEGGEPLLDWLNQLPETRQLLEAEFGGRPISKQNLSDWRRGGFAEWQLRRSVLETAADTAAHARAINGIGSRFFVDDLVVAFTAHMSGLLLRWDGGLTEEFQTKLRVFTRLRRDLSKLQRDVHWAFRDSDECAQLEAAAEERRSDALKKQALAPLHSFERRMELMEKHGVDRGEKISEALDTIDYGTTYPQWQPGPEEETEPEEKPVKKSRASRAEKPAAAPSVAVPSTLENPPSSQAGADPAQMAAVETSSTENPPVESSQVKPVLEMGESRESVKSEETLNAER